ncbi:MAG TPA: hypothetical protein PK280_10950 [Planctomycetota bacterium]|nr:hypothetical protein [Planctomycetota bacterium]
MSNEKIGFRLSALGFRYNGRSDGRMPIAECRLFSAVLLLAMVFAGSGCVSAGGYFGDRWADAKDVFTASVGTGGGAKARVGPLQVGAFYNSDLGGLRGGTAFWSGEGFGKRAHAISDMAIPVPVPRLVGHGIYIPCTSWENFDPRIPRPNAACDQTAVERGKDFDAFFPYVPLLSLSESPHYYTQLEVAAGVGGTLRLGFNPGELLDLLLGWTNVDIYGDDLAARREREEAEKKAKEKAKEPPPVPPAAPAAPQAPAAPAAGS